MSAHARSRAREMGVSFGEIEAAYLRPAREYRMRKYPGQVMRTCGRVAVPVDCVNGMVITVLWNVPLGERFVR
jgi:hypothetical protein